MLKKVTFSLDGELLDNFRKTCKENYINQSAIVAAMMQEIIDKYEKEDKK